MVVKGAMEIKGGGLIYINQICICVVQYICVFRLSFLIPVLFEPNWDVYTGLVKTRVLFCKVSTPNNLVLVVKTRFFRLFFFGGVVENVKLKKDWLKPWSY